MLPLAIPGIVTGIILTAGRIFGEAAALIFTAGLATPTHYDFTNFNLTDPRSPWSPFHPATTLSVYIWKLNSEGLGAVSSGRSRTRSAAVLVISRAALQPGRPRTRPGAPAPHHRCQLTR